MTIDVSDSDSGGGRDVPINNDLDRYTAVLKNLDLLTITESDHAEESDSETMSTQTLRVQPEAQQKIIEEVMCRFVSGSIQDEVESCEDLLQSLRQKRISL